MPPDPEPILSQAPENPGDSECLSEVWLDLDWSPWVPFNAPREYFYIQKAPGIYRIRPVGKDFLLYIGETGQSLHKKLSELRQALRRGDLMPWSDPHKEAPCLWAYWVEWIAAADKETCPDRSPDCDDETDEAEPVMLECSTAPLDASGAGRRGMEAFLLYRYRQDHGESPLCNFGRFHPRYRRSSNKNEKLRGGKLEDGQKDNPAGFPSIPPLEATGKPGYPDWMGLEWTPAVPLTDENIGKTEPGAGLYILTDAGTQEVLFIGQSDDIAGALPGQTKKEWGGHMLQFSYQILGQKVLPHNLQELANDLIGNFYEQNKKAPEFQYRKSP
ncbi:MAG: hypothetical protein M0Q92_07525 [Methanoregula sp.]|jgi:hypothetical protein|nr:hypothetical protein [Methanoregula sp.]